MGKPVIYYTVLEEKIERRYIVYNRFRDTISLKPTGQT
jgi:hypothetical protein